MRQILSISLPDGLVKDIKKNLTKRGFSSLSAYFQQLYKADNDNLISEAELLKIVRDSRTEYKKGKFLRAGSMADIL